MLAPNNGRIWDRFAPIYEQLLSHCPLLHFPPPWDFLTAPPHCRGPVDNPTGVLTDLRVRFDEATLRAAGVVSTSAGGGLELDRQFAGRDAALIALRDPPDGPLQGLWTARGCLPRHLLSIAATRMNHQMCQSMISYRLLFASPSIHDVALLNALDLPATLSLDLDRLTLQGLESVDSLFYNGSLAGLSGGPQILALVAWSPLSLDAQPSPSLIPAVKRFTQARNYLKLELSGVMAWCRSADELDHLRFLLSLRDRRLVRMHFMDSTNNFNDIAILLPPDDVPSETEAESGKAYTAAHADLLTQLATAARTRGPLSEEARRARDRYEERVQRTLIEPLQAWALKSSDPVVRNTGVQLTAVCHLVHRMSPLLLSQQTHQLGSALAAGSEPLPTKALSQYLALTTRLGSLVRDLCQWRTT